MYTTGQPTITHHQDPGPMERQTASQRRSLQMTTPDQSPQLSCAQLIDQPTIFPNLPPHPNDLDGSSLLTVFPREFAFHVARSNKGMIARTVLTNRSALRTVGFKFKTNAPGRFSVSPVLGIVLPLSSIEVYVRSQNSDFLPSDSFMVETVDLDASEVESLSPLYWRNLPTSRILSVYLSCRPPTPVPASYPGVVYPAAATVIPPLLTKPLRPMDNSNSLPTQKRKSEMYTKLGVSHKDGAPFFILRVILYVFLLWIVRLLFLPQVGGKLDDIMATVYRLGSRR